MAGYSRKAAAHAKRGWSSSGTSTSDSTDGSDVNHDQARINPCDHGITASHASSVRTVATALTPSQVPASIAITQDLTGVTSSSLLTGEEGLANAACLASSIRAKLFPKVKFVTSDDMLDFGGKISTFMLRELNVAPGSRQSYWTAIRVQVKSIINNRRNNVMGEIKREFMRELEEHVEYCCN